MEGHAEKFVERYCDFAKKKTNESFLQQVANPCIDDHLIPLEYYETARELSAICAQIVLKCLYLARIGRPVLLILWHDEACDTQIAKIDKSQPKPKIQTILSCGKPG